MVVEGGGVEGGYEERGVQGGEQREGAGAGYEVEGCVFDEVRGGGFGGVSGGVVWVWGWVELGGGEGD